MKFSIIVPVFNTSAHLERCLEALRAVEYPSSQFEILVVDNNSTDRCPEILACAPDIRVFRESKQGSYAARNRAVREARGELLAFTDSDCMPLPDWLRAMEASFRDPRCHIVLGPRLSESRGRLVRLIAEYETKKCERICRSNAPELYRGFTNNMGVRRSAYDRFGPFMEIPRGADTIFTRTVAHGLGCEAVCFDKTLRVVHAELESLAAYYTKMYTYGRSLQVNRQASHAKSLGVRDRGMALVECLREGNYSLLESIAFVPLLLGGVVAWHLGGIAARFAPRS